MNVWNTACLVGAAAFLGGCAQHADSCASTATVYTETVYEVPVFVEKRATVVNHRPAIVSIYRIGDMYFFNHDGRSYRCDYYPTITRIRPVVTRTYATGYSRPASGESGSITYFTPEGATELQAVAAPAPLRSALAKRMAQQPVRGGY